MPNISLDILIYLLGFGGLWFGSGLIVSSVGKLSHRIKISPFLLSFVVLGLLTSIPEIAVGILSVNESTPQVYVGNLLGGIPVLFLFVIPVLAIAGHGIKPNYKLGKESILLSIIVSIAPFFAVIDGKVTNNEAIFLIGFYIFAVFILNAKNKVVTKKFDLSKIKKYSILDFIEIIVGAIIVFVSSNIIVNKTLFFADFFHINPFYISIIILSFGTNLPEISLAVRSILTGNKDIAFGDYLGSASANTLLFGIFTLLSKGQTIFVGNFIVMTIIVIIGLIMLYKFARSKDQISSKEGIILILIYIAFAVFELSRK